MNTPNILELHHVVKQYPDFSLDRVSFSVPEGSIMGFIGENGAGKTTTMKLILGLIQKEQGQIRLFGEDSDTLDQRERTKIGYVFDECCFHEMLNAHEVGMIFAKLYETWDSQQYAAWIERFLLDPKKTVKEYSRGMRAKLSLAVALSHNAQLLVLDEALDGLDPIARDEMLEVFQEFVLDERRSILLSLHNTDDLVRVCDYITYIRAGRIVLSESKDELLERCAIVRAPLDAAMAVDASLLLGGRRHDYYVELLTGDRRQFERQARDLKPERATLHDIMLLYGREWKK